MGWADTRLGLPTFAANKIGRSLNDKTGVSLDIGCAAKNASAGGVVGGEKSVAALLRCDEHVPCISHGQAQGEQCGIQRVIREHRTNDRVAPRPKGVHAYQRVPGCQRDLLEKAKGSLQGRTVLLWGSFDFLKRQLRGHQLDLALLMRFEETGECVGLRGVVIPHYGGNNVVVQVRSHLGQTRLDSGSAQRRKSAAGRMNDLCTARRLVARPLWIDGLGDMPT